MNKSIFYEVFAAAFFILAGAGVVLYAEYVSTRSFLPFICVILGYFGVLSLKLAVKEAIIEDKGVI